MNRRRHGVELLQEYATLLKPFFDITVRVCTEHSPTICDLPGLCDDLCCLHAKTGSQRAIERDRCVKNRVKSVLDGCSLPLMAASIACQSADLAKIGLSLERIEDVEGIIVKLAADLYAVNHGLPEPPPRAKAMMTEALRDARAELLTMPPEEQKKYRNPLSYWKEKAREETLSQRTAAECACELGNL